MATIEFSEFTNAGTAQGGDIIVGLKNGENAQFTLPSGFDIPWNIVTTNETMSADNGYIVNTLGSVTLTVPASLSVGDTFEVVLINTGACVIQLNAGQTLQGGNQVSSTAGTLTMSTKGEAIRLLAYSSTELIMLSCVTHSFSMT